MISRIDNDDDDVDGKSVAVKKQSLTIDDIFFVDLQNSVTPVNSDSAEL